MLELLAVAIAATVGFGGYVKSRNFVRRRLRFTAWVEKPYVGLVAGVGATLLAAPVVALLPVVGAGTALALGLGIGAGVHPGAADARQGLIED